MTLLKGGRVAVRSGRNHPWRGWWEVQIRWTTMSWSLSKFWRKESNGSSRRTLFKSSRSLNGYHVKRKNKEDLRPNPETTTNQASNGPLAIRILLTCTVKASYTLSIYTTMIYIFHLPSWKPSFTSVGRSRPQLNYSSHTQSFTADILSCVVVLPTTTILLDQVSYLHPWYGLRATMIIKWRDIWILKSDFVCCRPKYTSILWTERALSLQRCISLPLQLPCSPSTLLQRWAMYIMHKAYAWPCSAPTRLALSRHRLMFWPFLSHSPKRLPLLQRLP